MEACESGWYACDDSWKVSTVGHLGGEEPETFSVTRRERDKSLRPSLVQEAGRLDL
jgi:hypothetical protein